MTDGAFGPVPLGWRFEVYDELPSTSDLCVERADGGEGGCLAVLARRQTKARGSRGRSWSDPGESLALSVLLRPEEAERARPDIWPFLAALAFHDALGGERPSSRLRIKWPNDILYDGRKLGGILIETGGGASPWVVIGFGGNLTSSPVVPGRRLACLGEFRVDCAPEPLALRLLEALDVWRTVLAQKGVAALHAAWLARGLPLGSPLVVRGTGTYAEGLFMGIGEGGELLLDCNGKVERVITGDVLFGNHVTNEVGSGRAAGH
ncbi:biotin--[acetyl-CoA-carboxylase] ligase [Acetobacter estunensis]|uniref:biotin--[acetyl-CoA-carboxylase] ligase n=1 Tax=Acetobacter estunensis TaxID=104097 RepID=UPI001C2D4EE2|nr:biotin--[acetyl-CoA-carboxylase] ligase [Acetobacter estunensis]